MRFQTGNKFRARKTVVDGIRFDSKREAGRYNELKLFEKQGDVKDIECQPKFELWFPALGHVKIKSPGYPRGRCVSYYADFRYKKLRGEQWEIVVEDVKGKDTPLSRLKRALVELIYGIEIRIIR